MPPTTPACAFDSAHSSRSPGSSAANVEKPSIERMWAASRTEAGLTVLESRFAFFEESGHAFLLVLERELRMEQSPLEPHALRKRSLVGAVDRFLDHHHHRERAGRDLLRHRERFFHQLVERHDARHQPSALGVLGDHDVAHQRQLFAAAQCVSGDCRDHGLADAQNVLPVARDVVGLEGVHVAEVLHGADVGAGGEGFRAAGDHDRPDALVGVVRIQRLGQLLHQLGIERIQLPGPVERDDADPLLLLELDEIRHVFSSGKHCKLFPMLKSFPLEPIEKASRQELKALQLERLRWSLKHAYDHVPHYRKKFVAAGVKPDDCRSLADLARFPFTTKADLRETYPFGMFAVPMDRIVRIHASSGTTGKPTVVGYTAKDIDTWTQVMARSIRAAGARPGDKVHVAYGYGLFTGGLGAHYSAERLGLAVIPLGGGMTERQVQLIADFKPEIIMVTPSYMLAIADEMERQGIDPAKCSLRIGIFGAEPWTNEMRSNIEKRLSLEAIDLYGLSEVIGPGVAQECIETKDGLTIWEDHFYPEVVDAASGKPLADGEKGELVFTSLTKEALPIIRYRTRDLTRLLPGTARTMRRMEKITGRSDDMLIIRGVNLFPSQIEELILKQPGLSPHYALEISKDGPLDHLTVLVEGNDAGAAGLQHSIKAYIGITVNVRVSSIERSIGKAKRVIDKRPK